MEPFTQPVVSAPASAAPSLVSDPASEHATSESDSEVQVAAAAIIVATNARRPRLHWLRARFMASSPGV
jgi:hypothetical protein